MTANLIMVKLPLNRIVSKAGADFISINSKNLYLNTPLKLFEYLKFKLDKFPEDFIKQYKLKEKPTHDGYVYIELWKGVYGLPQAGLIVKQFLDNQLDKQGYLQSRFTPVFWKNKWRPLHFTLVVDDFEVKYVVKKHIKKLIEVM